MLSLLALEVDLLRFGLSPLYVSQDDALAAADALTRVLRGTA